MKMFAAATLLFTLFGCAQAIQSPVVAPAVSASPAPAAAPLPAPVAKPAPKTPGQATFEAIAADLPDWKVTFREASANGYIGSFEDPDSDDVLTISITTLSLADAVLRLRTAACGQGECTPVEMSESDTLRFTITTPTAIRRVSVGLSDQEDGLTVAYFLSSPIAVAPSPITMLFHL